MRILLIFATGFFCAGGAWAQALSPMKGDVTTYTDRFALNLKAYNPYATAQRFTVRILNEDRGPARGVTATTPVIVVPPGEAAGFYVWGESPGDRRILVCLMSDYFATGEGAKMRGEVCGKYNITCR
jgi:hypothetical protein